MARSTPIPITRADEEARRTGRVRCRNVRSSIGEVVEVSGSGLRIRSRTKPPVREHQQFELSLHVLGRDVTIGSRAIWVRKRGWRRWEMGVQFTRVTDDARRSLKDLVRASMINEAVLPGRRRAG